MATKHIVKPGECLSRIAAANGFGSWEVIYNHPENADFKRRRPNPNLIYPGDVVVIPDREAKVVSLATGRTHRIVIKRPRRTLRLCLNDADRQPLADTPCTLTTAGQVIEGTTNAEGMVELAIPVDAEDGTLLAGGHEWPLKIAALNPLRDVDDDGISGMQARLRNLGHDPGESDGVLGPKTRAALRAFQVRERLTVSGEPDEPTRAKLVEVHGC